MQVALEGYHGHRYLCNCLPNDALIRYIYRMHLYIKHVCVYTYIFYAHVIKSPQLSFINIEDRSYSSRISREHDYEAIFVSLRTVLNKIWKRQNILSKQ